MPLKAYPFYFLLYPQSLFFVNSIARAILRASTAADASIRVDMIDIAFRDSFNRTYRSASAASYTIVIDYVSHFLRI